MRVGIFICECGGNISTLVDMARLRSEAEGMADVEAAEHLPFLCSKPGLERIKRSIQENALDRIIVAACSPHMHEEAFREVISEAGLNRYLLDCVNIREQCSWAHTKRDEATEKAVDLVRGGVHRVRALEEISPIFKNIKRRALVVGGGIAGIMCALQIADSGFQVTLVERRPSIGGHMAQLSKTFPTMDCAPCILGPRMSEVARHPNIELFTNAEVEQISGGVGDFHVLISQRPRGVDISKCVGCGKCSDQCPTVVPNEFDEGLYERKAVYRPFPEAVPSAYAIDFKNCKLCGLCAKICPSDAINLKDPGTRFETDVGAIVVATGYDLIDLSQWKNYSPPSPNVITALQMERIMIRELTEGNVLKRRDGKRVRNLAYILCAGSRDTHRGVPYCSRICCAYAIKQAVLLKKTLPYLRIWIYHTDVRMSGRGFEEFYSTAREMGVKFIHGKPASISTSLETDELIVMAEERDSGLLLRNRLDMVVLATAMVPSDGTRKTAERLGISLGDDYFVAEKHPKIAPVATLREGIFVAGGASGPKDIRDSVTDAQAAAAHVVKLFGSGTMMLSPVKPRLQSTLCTGCGSCVEACPQRAIEIRKGKAEIDIATCSGCGSCIVVCKTKALDLVHYTTRQLEEQVKGILAVESADVRVLCFLGDGVSYSALDAAGTARLSYSANIRSIRVPSTAIIGLRIVLHTFASGADAVLLCETEDSPEAKISEHRIEDLKNEMEKYGIERARISFQPVLLPLFRVIGRQLTTYVDQVKALGKLSPEVRAKAASALSEEIKAAQK